MIDVQLPDDGAPVLVRSFGACLAAVTEAGLEEVPAPSADLRGAMAHWRSWLAGRGFGLVPIAKPRNSTGQGTGWPSSATPKQF